MAADDQQFCLRWNNHQSTLISVFDTLLENGTLVDCTLAAEGQYLKAHKVVLSACSPYLEILLSQHNEKHPIVILKDVTFNELKAMMDYMYRGEVNISQDQLGTFLKSAESLQIKGLTDNGTESGDSRDVGSTAPKRQDPPPRKIPPATPPIPQPRAQPSLPLSSGLSIEQRRTSSQISTDSPRDGSISPSLRKRRRTRRPSGDDSNLTANDTSNSCDLPSQAQSTPLASNVPSTPVTMPTPIVPPTVNPKSEFNRLDASNFNSVPPESGLLKEKIEPPSEPLLEPKTEYLDYLNNDNSVEDLTLDDDDDMDMSQPGPSHGGDPSQQGYSQWHMSGDQTGTADEVFMAAQEAVNAQQRDSQDFENTKKSDGETSSVKKMCVDMNPVVGLRVLRPEELGLNIGRSSCNENKTCQANKRTVSQSCNSFDNDDILKDFFKELKTMVQGGARKIVFQIKRTDPQCATATSVCEVSTSDDDDCVIIAEPDVEKKDILESSVAITPNVNQESKIVEPSLNQSKASDGRSNFQPTNPNSHSIYQPANSASTSGSNSPCVSQSDMFSPNVLTPILSIEPTNAYQQLCTINSVNSNLVCKKDNPSVMKLTTKTMAALGFVPQPYPKNKHNILKYTRPQRLILPATDKPSATQPVYKVAQPVQPQPQPQPVVYPQYILSTNDTNQFNQNAVTNQQVGQHINQPMVILNPNQAYVTNLQPFQ